jgi:hypothetical protein
MCYYYRRVLVYGVKQCAEQTGKSTHHPQYLSPNTKYFVYDKIFSVVYWVF